MDGPETFGITKETAQVIAGSAVGTGGYLYFTSSRGWRMIAGALTSFGGGCIGYTAVLSFVDLEPGLAAGVACTVTLGAIMAVRRAAEKLDAVAWIGKVEE